MDYYSRGLTLLQKLSMSLMAVLVLLTFIGANAHAILWKSSEWLVSTVLPAVVIDLTNEQRITNHEAPLQRNSVLDKAAQLKAEHMAKHQYFAHHSPDGVSPWYWFDQVGYIYAHAGENLAIHFTDSTEVVDAWMKSPTHRENIVGPQYLEIGVGTAKGVYQGYDTVYVVQLFGTPAVSPAPTAVLETSSPVVAVSSEQLPTVVSAVESSGAESPIVLAETETVKQQETEESELSDDVAYETPAENAVVQASEVENSLLEEQALESLPSTDVVFVESLLIATSSGLVAAQIVTPQLGQAGTSLAYIATQPNLLLEMMYIVIAVVIVFLLLVSIALEARRMRLVQVAYGVLLLCGMGVLWYTHMLLTGGAVIA
ncbi:MAG: hypothetical protein RL097_504 [Candidatus Parcubacteria bacterium]|jgi:hypothetical protein